MKTRAPLLLLTSLLLVVSCSKKDSNPTDPGVETGPPQIISLTAEKTEILFGGQDPAIITCTATGGNLSYVWEVDLGDIIPMNSSHSKVSFNGAACCVGEKTIKCTVSNSLGSVSKTIVITILEEIRVPEIITIETDKSEIHAGSNEIASLVCYALGGHLQYRWETDCGTIKADTTDRSKASMTATATCIGTRNVTCTVSNEVGTISKTVQLLVKN